MKIIPAIDLMNGRCVRLTQGDYQQQTTYRDDPTAVAGEFEKAGFTHLHVVDLEGAKAGRVINLPALDAILNNTNLIVDFGGGIKTTDDIRTLLAHGVSQINLGSVAVKQPELVHAWLAEFGAERIIISADVRDERIAVHGWQETSGLELIPFLEAYSQAGIRYVTCTDISKDGMLQGSNTALYKKIVTTFPQLHVTASGGIGSLEDVQDLRTTGVAGVIVGKAIYEQTIDLHELASLC